MGLQPILEQLHCGQLELCRKHHRSVDAILMLTLGVNLLLNSSAGLLRVGKTHCVLMV